MRLPVCGKRFGLGRIGDQRGVQLVARPATQLCRICHAGAAGARQHPRGIVPAFVGVGKPVMGHELDPECRQNVEKGGFSIGARGRLVTVFALTLIATALAGLLALEISGDHTLGRILANADQGFSKPGFGRDAIHATAGRAIEAAPLTGHGLDTFRQVVYQYRTEDLVTSWVRIDKAHSVYLELITELGYIGFALLMAAMAWILGTIALGLMRRRRDFIFPSLVLGSAALIGTHNLLDFSIQMPAIAVTWAAMLGVGYAQAWGSDDFSRAGYVRTENALIPRCQGDGNFK